MIKTKRAVLAEKSATSERVVTNMGKKPNEETRVEMSAAVKSRWQQERRDKTLPEIKVQQMQALQMTP